MKPRFIVTGVLITLVISAGFRYALHNQPVQLQHLTQKQLQQHRLIMACSPDWSQINTDSLAMKIGVLPGWGNYRWKISTKNDSAQFYFNQGINMYYAFHIIESMASFKKAALFDDHNAMINWAEALAYGPNINDYGYAATPEAYAAAQKALQLKAQCSPAEQMLIEAMAVRYSADSTVSRAYLNQLYAEGMKKAYDAYKQNADVGTLYADALMLQHPWDYWKHNGDAEPWTPHLLEVLEAVLKTNPEHPGANHYYIHSVEASFNSKRAMASAGRLGKLMPGVSHMIHMPSHIYIRNGKYTEGIKVNEMSVTGYNKYTQLYPDVQNNAPLYLIHNLHMQSNCAMMKANYTYSTKSAMECRNSFDTSFWSAPAPMGTYVQYVYMTPVFNDVRFGKWSAILNNSDIPAQYAYAHAILHWAKGMAFAAVKNFSAAQNELITIQQDMKHPDMVVRMEPFNASNDAAKIAVAILEGAIAEQQMDYKNAITYFQQAVQFEDALIYNEPRDWLLPAREYLATALLKSGNAAGAERIAREDLAINPNTHWSLYTLYQSLLQQHKKEAAAQLKKQFNAAFEGADIIAGSLPF
ncbi:MAG: hypothetical protein JST86_10965 [Bacteroidetes bacterium]|nr:hypothetical protein [Bacteroidota bacterium]